MTDREWLQCEDPEALLAFVRQRWDRKMRLAAVAACRLVDDLLPDDRLRQALAVADRFADGAATKAELEAAWQNAGVALNALLDAYRGTDEEGAEDRHDAIEAAWAARVAVSAEPADAFFHLSMFTGYEFLVAHVLRDVFGPPTPARFHAAWLTADVAALARSIYEERRFEAMPVLADALEAAGCRDAGILGHCRQMEAAPGSLHLQHTRGCWVLDLLLGRS